MNWRAIGSSISQGIQTAFRVAARVAARVVGAVNEAASPAGVEESTRALGQAGQSYLRDLGRQPSRVFTQGIYLYPIATIDILSRLSSEDRQRVAIQAAVFGGGMIFPAAIPSGLRTLVTMRPILSWALGQALPVTTGDNLLISPVGTPSVQQFASSR